MHGGAEKPPVRTPLDCSLGFESYPNSFFFVAWITAFCCWSVASKLLVLAIIFCFSATPASL